MYMYSYVCKTLKEVNIEPGYHCTTYNEAVDVNKRKDQKIFHPVQEKTISHCDKLSSNVRSEGREGTTYERNIGPNLDATKDNSIVKLLTLAQ